jgi:hypothetical protein
MPINNRSEEPAFYIDIRILLDPRLKVVNDAGATLTGVNS